MIKLNRLVYNILNEQLKVDQAFNQLKMLTNCNDDYLNQLKRKSQESEYSLLNIINIEINKSMHIDKNLDIYKTSLILEYLNTSKFYRLIRLFKINRFIYYFSKKLSKYMKK